MTDTAGGRARHRRSERAGRDPAADQPGADQADRGAGRAGWLERAEPSLPEALAAIDGPVVVVPLLLSTGYHVKVDIPTAVAGRPQTAVARQLGPDDRITRVVLDRLLVGRERRADRCGAVRRPVRPTRRRWSSCSRWPAGCRARCAVRGLDPVRVHARTLT